MKMTVSITTGQSVGRLTNRFLGLSLEGLDLRLELVDGVAVLVVRSSALVQLRHQLADAFLVLAHVLVGLCRPALFRLQQALQLVHASLHLLDHLLAAARRRRLSFIQTHLHLLQLHPNTDHTQTSFKPSNDTCTMVPVYQ